MSNDMIIYQEKLKTNIKKLINKNRLEEAKEILVQYEGIAKDDIDIYSIKGVMAMMKGDMEEAQRILNEGLENQSYNYDILYNLAYLYESKEKYIAAYHYYNKLEQIAEGEILKEVTNKIKELEKIEKIKKYKLDQTNNIIKEKINFAMEKHIKKLQCSKIN